MHCLPLLRKCLQLVAAAGLVADSNPDGALASSGEDSLIPDSLHDALRDCIDLLMVPQAAAPGIFALVTLAFANCGILGESEEDLRVLAHNWGIAGLLPVTPTAAVVASLSVGMYHCLPSTVCPQLFALN